MFVAAFVPINVGIAFCDIRMPEKIGGLPSLVRHLDAPSVCVLDLPEVTRFPAPSVGVVDGSHVWP